MTEFIIVAAAVAALASASPTLPASPADVPDLAPARAFSTYPSAAACEAAAGQLPGRPGLRFVCLPVELPAGGLADAY